MFNTFSSHMSLMGHIRFAHSARNLLDMITVTNPCVCCNGICSSRSHARFHAQRAVRYGRCITGRFPFAGQASIPTSLVCVLCGLASATLPDLQIHLLTHWTGLVTHTHPDRDRDRDRDWDRDRDRDKDPKSKGSTSSGQSLLSGVMSMVAERAQGTCVYVFE